METQAAGSRTLSGVKAASAACWACPEKTLKRSNSRLSRSCSRVSLRRRRWSFRSVPRSDRCCSETEVWASPSSLRPAPPAASHRFCVRPPASPVSLLREPTLSPSWCVFVCFSFRWWFHIVVSSSVWINTTAVKMSNPHLFCSLCPPVWRTSESQPSLRETGDLRAQGEVPPLPPLPPPSCPPPFSVRLQMVLVLEGLALLPSDPCSSFQLCLPSCVLHSSAVAAAVAWHRCCSASMSSNQKHQAGRVCLRFTSKKCRTWKQAFKIVKKEIKMEDSGSSPD